MLTNVVAKRRGKLGVWTLGGEPMWLSVGLFRADRTRRRYWNKAFLEKGEGIREISRGKETLAIDLNKDLNSQCFP